MAEIEWISEKNGDLAFACPNVGMRIARIQYAVGEYMLALSGSAVSYHNTLDDAKAAVPGEIRKVIEALDDCLPDDKWDKTDRIFAEAIERGRNQAKIEVLEELLATVEGGVWTYEQIQDKINELMEEKL